MVERKRRGLGRGLGALINNDGEQEDVPSIPVADEKAEDQATQLNVEEIAKVERPIDVFFTAKSHGETQTVSRETSKATPRKNASTAPRRTSGSKRAAMPDLKSSVAHSPARAAPDVSRETEAAISPTADDQQNRSGASLQEVPVSAIRPNPRQPREVFDEDDMAELVHSIREIGVLQPIVVRPVGDGQFELIMGERRWRASEAAGRETVPAVVRDTSDENLLRDALLENIHRSQLNPLEEAAAYKQLLDDFAISQEELAQRIGRSRPQISNALRLMKLPPAVQRRVAAGVLSSGHARALLSLTSEDQMEELAQRIVAEGLSVRGAEEAASLIKRRADDAGVSRETNRLPSAARYQQLDEYAEALTDRLDTQVKITLGAKKGRIAIDFASIEDLNRIMEVMRTQAPDM